MQERFPTGDPPVDMERLRYVADGDPGDLREIVDIYIRQTEEQLNQLDLAVQNLSAKDVQALAHSCVGASSTCGMAAIIAPLRELETMAREKRLSGAPEQLASARSSFEQIKQFLTTQPEAIPSARKKPSL